MKRPDISKLPRRWRGDDETGDFMYYENDVMKLQKYIEYLEAKFNIDVLADVSNCEHPRNKRRYIGTNLLKCEVCGYEFS